MKETVSDEAHEDQWGVRSIDKVQRTACSVRRGTSPRPPFLDAFGILVLAQSSEKIDASGTIFGMMFQRPMLETAEEYGHVL